MTSKERFLRMYQHKEADRIPIIDSPWAGTIARWQREGLPAGVDWVEYFDTDKIAGLNAGADDYMVKPVDEIEMLLRIQALLRRARIAVEHELVIGNTTLDYNSFTIKEEVL